MNSFDIKSCWKSFSAQVQHVRRLLLPPESRFHVCLQRYFNLTSPHLQRTHWQPIRPFPMEQQHSQFHYALEFSPHANLQSGIIENPSADAQTQVMVCDEWLWRVARYAAQTAPHIMSAIVLASITCPDMLIYVWGKKSVISEVQ